MIIDKTPYTLLKSRYTVADFDAFRSRPENSDGLYELIDGEISARMVTEEHGIIVLNIAAPLREFVRAQGLGRVGVEINYRLPADRYNDRLPDVSFMAKSDEPVVKQGSVPRMPDLTVEVKSLSNSETQLRKKAEYYLQNGSRLVWLVYPQKRTIEVCTLADDPDLPGAIRIETLGDDDTLNGGAVLPGFTLAVADILDTD